MVVRWAMRDGRCAISLLCSRPVDLRVYESKGRVASYILRSRRAVVMAFERWDQRAQMIETMRACQGSDDQPQGVLRVRLCRRE